MRVRSPRISDGYEEQSSSTTGTRSHELAAFAHDSDAIVFLPKNATLSDHHDPKEAINVVEEDEERSVAKENVVKRRGQVWRFLVQPFTWISMLCRYRA